MSDVAWTTGSLDRQDRQYEDECVRAAGSVELAVSAMQSDLERLHKASMVLVDRIGPVLGPDHPRPAPDRAAGEDSTGCGLADTLRSIDRDVQIVTERLQAAAERVQL